MRIVLIGAGGQLGTALMDRLSGEIVAPSRHDLDLTDAQKIHSALAAARPDLIINAAAYNFVDRAEDEPERAFAVNALGVGVLARSCGGLDVPLVHVSSDYVFGLDDGRSGP